MRGSLSFALLFTMSIAANATDPLDMFKGLLREIQNVEKPQTQPQSPPSSAPTPAPAIPAPAIPVAPPSEMKKEDLDKAFSCGIGITGVQISFDSPSCQSPAMDQIEQERLLGLLRQRYLRSASGGTKMTVDFALYSRDQDEYQRKEQERLRQQQERAAPVVTKNTEDKSDEEKRMAALKAGKVKVESFRDAELLHGPKSFAGIMESPLLSPDGQYYGGAVVIDEQESEGTLRVKYARAFTRQPVLYYAWLRLDAKTKNFAPQSMRIGYPIRVIGTYSGNHKYRTVAGEPKTAPVLNAAYIFAVEMQK